MFEYACHEGTRPWTVLIALKKTDDPVSDLTPTSSDEESVLPSTAGS